MDSPPPLSLHIRIRHGGGTIIGPGRADLLAGIAATGSIAAAGRGMGMSYKRAWALVEAMNTVCTAPLVTATKGGAGGGGARLTAEGEAVLAGYRALADAAASAGAEPLRKIAAVVAQAADVPPGGESG